MRGLVEHPGTTGACEAWKATHQQLSRKSDPALLISIVGFRGPRPNLLVGLMTDPTVEGALQGASAAIGSCSIAHSIAINNTLNTCARMRCLHIMILSPERGSGTAMRY